MKQNTNVKVSRVANVGNPNVSITCTQTNDSETVPMTNFTQSVCNTSAKIPHETNTNVKVSRVANVGNPNVSITCTQTNDSEKLPITNFTQSVCNTSTKIYHEINSNVKISRVANVGNPHVSITCSQANDNSEKAIKKSGKESETDVNFSSRVNSKRINDIANEDVCKLVRSVISI